MQGARLVNTPAMNRIGRAVKGLDESCAEMCEKSTIVRDAKEGCYFRASPFAMIAAPDASLFLGQQLLEQVERPRVFTRFVFRSPLSATDTPIECSQVDSDDSPRKLPIF